MNAGKLRHRIDVLGKSEVKNALKEKTYTDAPTKTIWGQIIPQTGSLQKQQANTILTNVTHKIIVRYSAGKDIKEDMHLVFKGHRFDIKFILNPYFANKTLEIFVEEVIT